MRAQPAIYFFRGLTDTDALRLLDGSFRARGEDIDGSFRARGENISGRGENIWVAVLMARGEDILAR